MDKELLLRILKEGVERDSYGTLCLRVSSKECDLFWLENDGANVLLNRSWGFRDTENFEVYDCGASIAKIEEEKFYNFLDDVLRENKSERIFNSTNTYSSEAHIVDNEELDLRDYEGKVKVNISISEDDKIEYTFLPTIPKIPRLRLEDGIDYFVEKLI